MRKNMVKIMSGLILLGLGWSGRSEDVPNLIQNPSFEIIAPATGLPERWSTMIRQGKAQKAECQFNVVKEAQDGNNAVRITVPEQGKTGALAEFSQMVAVKPNTRYFFAIYLKTVGTTRAWPCAFVEERTRDKGYPRYTTASNHQARSTETVPRDQYGLQEITFTTGPETYWLNISLRLQNLGFGAVQFDNAILIEQAAEK